MTYFFDPAPLLVLAHASKKTDREVGEFLGVALGTVQKWRNGQRRVHRNTADQICIRLDLHPVLIWDEWERT